MDKVTTKLGIIAIALGVVGLVMQFQSVSLMTGAGVLWIGAVLAAAGAVTSFVVETKIAVKIVTVVMLAFCIANVIYVEHQLDVKRQELQQIFNK